MSCVYLAGESWDGPVKLGYSDDPHRRLRELQTGNPRTLALFGYIEFETKIAAECVEKIYHKYLSETKFVTGGEEWFSVRADWLLLMLECFPSAYRELEPLPELTSDPNWSDRHLVDLLKEYSNKIPLRFEEIIDELIYSKLSNVSAYGTN
jgi:hypothetical protein